jgi:hypothetical protein
LVPDPDPVPVPVLVPVPVPVLVPLGLVLPCTRVAQVIPGVLTVVLTVGTEHRKEPCHR